MSKPRGDQPRKNPYRHIAGRMSLVRGMMVNVIQDIDEQIYYVGLGLTVANIHDAPYGCRTSYDKEDAYSDLSELAD